ncbi:MAG: hypothetical protein HYY14_04060 [Candidatus Omnitrophica bacterium]|nr:hypothetical protein [Candidatus Omnitrophota bacterium]
MKLKQKYRYELDPLNRLVIRSPRAPGSPLRPVHIVDGTYEIGPGNTLAWQASTREGTPLHRVIFTGTWSLTRRHELALTLERSKTQVFGDTLVFKGEVGEPEAQGLAFTARGGIAPGGQKKQVLRLEGTWQADPRNRLVFLAQRGGERGPHPITLEGTWEIGAGHQILYRYETSKAGRREERTIQFAGSWSLTQENRLDYLLEKSGRSAFRFRAKLEHAPLMAHVHTIPFAVSIELKNGRRVRRRVSLTGQWKVRPAFDVTFELDYGGGRIETLRFASSIRLNTKDQIVLELKAQRGEPVGIELAFLRRFWRDAEFFVKLRREADNTAVEAGARVPF